MNIRRGVVGDICSVVPGLGQRLGNHVLRGRVGFALGRGIDRGIDIGVRVGGLGGFEGSVDPGLARAAASVLSGDARVALGARRVPIEIQAKHLRAAGDGSKAAEERGSGGHDLEG